MERRSPKRNAKEIVKFVATLLAAAGAVVVLYDRFLTRPELSVQLTPDIQFTDTTFGYGSVTANVLASNVGGKPVTLTDSAWLTVYVEGVGGKLPLHFSPNRKLNNQTYTVHPNELNLPYLAEVPLYSSVLFTGSTLSYFDSTVIREILPRILRYLDRLQTAGIPLRFSISVKTSNGQLVSSNQVTLFIAGTLAKELRIRFRQYL
jgi:hypothetical protein